MAFVFLEDIAFVTNVSNFTVFVSFMVINASLIVLRCKRPELRRPFQVPLSWGRIPLLPVMGILFNAFMLAQLSRTVMAVGIGLMLAGWLMATVRRSIAVGPENEKPE